MLTIWPNKSTVCLHNFIQAQLQCLFKPNFTTVQIPEYVINTLTQPHDRPAQHIHHNHYALTATKQVQKTKITCLMVRWLIPLSIITSQSAVHTGQHTTHCKHRRAHQHRLLLAYSSCTTDLHPPPSPKLQCGLTLVYRVCEKHQNKAPTKLMEA